MLGQPNDSGNYCDLACNLGVRLWVGECDWMHLSQLYLWAKYLISAWVCFCFKLIVRSCVFALCLHSFGKQLGGRRGCECITLEPSEMIVVSIEAASLSFCLGFGLPLSHSHHTSLLSCRPSLLWPLIFVFIWCRYYSFLLYPSLVHPVLPFIWFPLLSLLPVSHLAWIWGYYGTFSLFWKASVLQAFFYMKVSTNSLITRLF